MNKVCKILIFSAFVVFGTVACRRSLEEAYSQTALIPVRIDWSVSGVDVQSMHRASVWFFPKEGGSPFEYRLEGDVSYTEVALPVGTYSVLVFNETMDNGDWVGISFSGTDQYETFVAYARPIQSRGFYSRNTGLDLVENPDALAAWSMDTFEVTADMVSYTRSKSKTKAQTTPQPLSSLDQATRSLVGIQPQPCVEQFNINMTVSNLSSSIQSTGVVSGFSKGVYLHSGQKLTDQVVHPFLLNGRSYHENGKDGTVSTSFSVFGQLHQGEQAAQYHVALDFVLVDGTEHNVSKFDITEQVVVSTVQPVTTYNVQLEYHDLPDMGQMNTGISVSTWDEVIIPIK